MIETTPSTSLDEITQIHSTLHETFRSGKTRPLAFRRAQLLGLARMFQENAESLMAAVHEDLGRHKIEITIPEMGPVVGGALRTAEMLEEWVKPEKPAVEEWRSSWDTTIYHEAKGAVVIISPWNYTYVIALAPMIGAIAAGCTIVIKPSELSPSCGRILAELFPRYLDPSAYRVVLGGVTETTRLLELRWNHIFFTGSNRVGRIVAAAAAKHVTPLTLELGGKCPVYVDSETDLGIAAKRILWGKQQNTGQVCVAPDYVLVPRGQQEALAEAFAKAYKDFYPYPKGALDPDSDLGKIISPTHHSRLLGILEKTKGQIVVGGNYTETTVEPTIVKDVSLDDALMQDEIFGPILAIVPVDDVDAALRVIRERATPLVIYVFSENSRTRELFVTSTASGSLVFNDTFGQLAVYEMPFGGQGESGYGAYLGRFSFETFVHRRSSITVPLAAEPFLGYRYPPYSEQAFQFFHSPVLAKIPDA